MIADLAGYEAGYRRDHSTNIDSTTQANSPRRICLAGRKSMAMTKRYDHANEERYGGAIEALYEAGRTGSAEALAAARWKQTD